MKKYLGSFWRYFSFYLLGFIAFFLFSFLVRHLNEFLSGVFPDLFKIYNPISNREELILQNRNIAFISAILSVFMLTFLATRQDNSKYENIISKTDGFYRMRDGVKLYFSEFAYADAISAILVPLSTVFISLVKIPNDAAKFLKIVADCLDGFLAIPLAFTERCGFTAGVILLVLISVVARIPSTLLSLAHWRGVWLSSTER